ncbi:MAG: DUF4111 domain-containing protein [Anaerolineales bacterium]|nr:DUF4111 domain-containing protein [Anaerolineales bacterium]
MPLAHAILKHETADLNEIVERYIAEIHATLQDNLLGIYLRGSLASGDFIPASSDIDLLAATVKRVGPVEFTDLLEMHARIAALPNAYANRVEIAYIEREALKQYKPGQTFPTLGQGEELTWSEHPANWLLERWMVREQGIPLYGPDPRTLIDPISTAEIRQAIRSLLGYWETWAQEPDDPDWLLVKGHQAYVIETMCRALYALENGELAGKAQAAAWASAALPEPWRTLVAASQTWRTSKQIDEDNAKVMLAFVHWTAEQTIAG